MKSSVHKVLTSLNLKKYSCPPLMVWTSSMNALLFNMMKCVPPMCSSPNAVKIKCSISGYVHYIFFQSKLTNCFILANLHIKQGLLNTM